MLTPEITPALMECQASSTRVFSVPGSAMCGSVASKAMPCDVFVKTTVPMGCCLVVMPEERQGIPEQAAVRVHAVALAVQLRRARNAAEATLIGGDRFDFEQAVGAVHLPE